MSGDIKLMSYLEASANEDAQELKEAGSFVSSAKQGVMGDDSVACVRDSETLALLQLLKMGRRDIDDGKTCSMEEAFSRVRKQLNLDYFAK